MSDGGVPEEWFLLSKKQDNLSAVKEDGKQKKKRLVKNPDKNKVADCTKEAMSQKQKQQNHFK